MCSSLVPSGGFGRSEAKKTPVNLMVVNEGNDSMKLTTASLGKSRSRSVGGCAASTSLGLSLDADRDRNGRGASGRGRQKKSLDLHSGENEDKVPTRDN